MDARRYFLNVDVESRLKNIDYLTTKCKEHIYKLDDSPHLNFDSVTTFIGSFFEEFDAPKIAKKLEGKGRYQDMTAEDLIDSWKKLMIKLFQVIMLCQPYL